MPKKSKLTPEEQAYFAAHVPSAANRKTVGTQIKVEKYKGEKELERGLAKMLAAGWTVENQSTRKAAYSLATGVFTSKQIHTVTFRRG